MSQQEHISGTGTEDGRLSLLNSAAVRSRRPLENLNTSGCCSLHLFCQRFFKRLARSGYAVCFTVCHGMSRGENNETVDGYVCSLVVLVIGIAFAFSFSITAFLLKDDHMPFTALDSMLIVFQLCGSLVFLIFFCAGRNRVTVGDPDENENIVWTNRRFKHYLPIIGMMIFAFVANMLNLLSISAFASCADLWHVCHSTAWLSYILHELKEAAGIVFMWLAVAFCLVFHSSQFKPNCWTRFGLSILLTVVLAIWFNILLNDSTFHANKQVRWANYCSTNWTSIYSSTGRNKTLTCLNQSTKEFSLLEKFVPYMYPCYSEFALIVSEILLHLFFRTRKTHQNQQTNNTTAADCCAISSDCNQTDVEDEPHPCDSTTAENSTLVTADIVPSRTVATEPHVPEDMTTVATAVTDERSTNQKKINRRQKVDSVAAARSTTAEVVAASLTADQVLVESHQLHNHSSANETDFKSGQSAVKLFRTFALVLGILINSVLLLSGILTYADNYRYSALFSICRTVCHILLLITIILSMSLMRSMKKKRSSVKGPEYLLIITSVGSYFYLFIEMYSDIYCLHNRDKVPCNYTYLEWVGFLHVVFDLLEITCQIQFIILVSRVDIRTSLAKSVIKTVILFVAITDGFLWAQDSFVEIKNAHAQPIPQVYLDSETWHTVQHVIMPLAIFFRFNSMLILLKSYFNVENHK